MSVGDQTPALYFGCPVPAHEDLVPADRGGGLVGRMSVPDEAIGAVRVGILIGLGDLCHALAEAHVEDGAALRVELGEVRDRTPADEDVAVRKKLRVSFERHEQLLRMAIAPAE